MEQVTTIPITKMTDEEIKQELKDYGVKVHHKTGTAKLAELLADVRKNPSAVTQDIATDVSIEDRPYNGGLPGASKAAIEAATKHFQLTPTQAAMRLIRVVVTPNDPLMSSYPGLIFTVGVSSINNGRSLAIYASFIYVSNCSSDDKISIPLPPKTYDGLIKTGYPIFETQLYTSFGDDAVIPFGILKSFLDANFSKRSLSLASSMAEGEVP